MNIFFNILVYIAFDDHNNIKATSKLVLLKISIGLQVVQGLILDILIQSGSLGNNDDDNNYDSSDKAKRLYYFIVLVEYVVLAIVMYWSFGSEIVPSQKMLDKCREKNLDGNASPGISYNEFISKIFTFSDVFYNIAPSQLQDEILERNKPIPGYDI